MAETFQFQCRDCKNIVERPRNPRACPSCDGTVMKPAELSEPGASTNEIQTQDFDVSEELGRLDQITDDKTPSEGSSKDSSQTDSTSLGIPEEKSTDPSSQKAASSTFGAIVERIRNLF